MIDGIKQWWQTRRLSKFLSSSNNGWLLYQEGGEYDLKKLHFDEDLDCYYIERAGERLYFEDHISRMGRIMGHPLGLASSQGRAVVNAHDAELATAMDEKTNNKNPVDDDDVMQVGTMRESLHVARIEKDRGNNVDVINPFADLDDHPSIVDLRPTWQLFRRAARPDTPRKAAKNAVEAERAKSGPDLGQIGYVGSLFAAFLLGAITVEFIAGGGASVPSVGIMIEALNVGL